MSWEGSIALENMLIFIFKLTLSFVYQNHNQEENPQHLANIHMQSMLLGDLRSLSLHILFYHHGIIALYWVAWVHYVI